MIRLAGVLRRVRKGVTPVLAMTLVAIFLGALLIAGEFSLSGRWLVATGTIVGATGLMLLVWNTSRTGTAVRSLMRRDPVVVTPAAAPAPVIVEVPVPAKPVARAHAVEEPGDALLVPIDVSSQLFRFAYAPSLPTPGQRVIALVGSDALADSLRSSSSVVRLHPSASSAEIALSGADTLIIEEDALTSGVWRSALDPQGTALLMELLGAMAAMARRFDPVYVLTSTSLPRPAAMALRSDATLIDEYFVASSSEDRPATVLNTLVAHRNAMGGATL